MQLLLKLKDSRLFENAGDVRQFFDTPINNSSDLWALAPTVPLRLEQGQLYLQLAPGAKSGSDWIYVNTDIFNKKLAANELRFMFDQHNMLLTLARSIVAGIMSQTHTYNLSQDLVDIAADTYFPSHLQENLQLGIIYIFPVVILAYLLLQYGDYYYKTGQCLKWDDPKFHQMLRDSGILGIQSLCICVSFAISRACIPLLLSALTFLPSGLVMHLLVSLVFGLLFASSLLVYDLVAVSTGYGQLTISPGMRFFKNWTIGTSLYLIQLIPGLGHLNEFERIARATLAFLVPNTVNYVSRYLPSWHNKSQVKPPAPVLDDQHDMKTSLTAR